FRRLVPPLALSLVSLGALVTSGGSARAADPPAVVCTTTATQHYSPGLTLVSRPTRITASATYACTGAGSVDTARLGFDYTVDAGCLPTSSPVTTGISVGTYPGSDPLACATPQGVTSSQGELVLTLTQPF
ncbi:hypothetical protein, partial [Kitasatospora setae]|uniref:hypothetical protein n=1 Tax=Kitasatospora setae TaxID=2066 RepID=UPI000527E24F